MDTDSEKVNGGLPDCRTKRGTGVLRSPFGNLVPVYCANCGKSGGFVTRDWTSFVYYLCDRCAEVLKPADPEIPEEIVRGTPNALLL